MADQTKVFDFTAPEFINGQWTKTRRFGTGNVVGYPRSNTGTDGYRTDNGGYVLEVIDSNHYSVGTVITVSRGAVRHWISDLV